MNESSSKNNNTIDRNSLKDEVLARFEPNSASSPIIMRNGGRQLNRKLSKNVSIDIADSSELDKCLCHTRFGPEPASLLSPANTNHTNRSLKHRTTHKPPHKRNKKRTNANSLYIFTEQPKPHRFCVHLANLSLFNMSKSPALQ